MPASLLEIRVCVRLPSNLAAIVRLDHILQRSSIEWFRLDFEEENCTCGAVIMPGMIERAHRHVPFAAARN